MRLNNFKLRISRMVANPTVVLLYCSQHTPSFHILSNMFLVGTANRALTFGYQTLRFGDLQLDSNLTDTVNLPALFVAVCCGVGLATGLCLQAVHDATTIDGSKKQTACVPMLQSREKRTRQCLLLSSKVRELWVVSKLTEFVPDHEILLDPLVL